MYLDIDDNYQSGSLICVAYVAYNSTHYVNVNKALRVEGDAKISNYDIEFSPYSWSLYIPKQDIIELHSLTMVLIIPFVFSAALVIYK